MYNNNRVVYIDLLRIISCFLVILTHSHFSDETTDNYSKYFTLGIMLLCMPASELFISLSGAALLPIRRSMKEFLITRLKKLIPPFVIWSIVIALYNYILEDKTISNLFFTITSIPFKPVTYQFWFIYVIIGLYLFAPIISPWLRNANKRQIEFFLALWCLTLLAPFWNSHTNIIYDTTGNYNYTTYYFSGFLGYWLLGYYLNKYPIRISLNFRFVFVLLLFSIYLSYLIMRYSNGDMNLILISNLQIGAALYMTIIYSFIQKLNIKKVYLKEQISNISKYSFGIYLTHPII